MVRKVIIPRNRWRGGIEFDYRFSGDHRQNFFGWSAGNVDDPANWFGDLVFVNDDRITDLDNRFGFEPNCDA